MAERSSAGSSGNAAVLSAGFCEKTVDPKGSVFYSSFKGLSLTFYTYILQSGKTGAYYFGHCHDLSLRLSAHNGGKVKSTKNKRPWKIHYFEKYTTKSEAFQREQFFKSFEGRKWLYEKEILKRTE